MMVHVFVRHLGEVCFGAALLDPTGGVHAELARLQRVFDDTSLTSADSQALERTTTTQLHLLLDWLTEAARETSQH